jgi:UDP-2,3-diacylglucosamine hydrolase
MEINSRQPINLTDTRKVYFISDAHLTFTNGRVEKLLAGFLAGIKKDTSHLYIIGDLFDFWLEYKNVIPAAFLKILSALLDLTQSGVEVIYLPGNHDFWLGDYLHRQVGVVLTDEKLDVIHQGKRIHLLHGDGLAYGDYGYRFIKKLFRFKPNIWLYKLLPVDLAYRLAFRVSGASREYTSKKPKDLQGYYDYAGERIKAGSDAVIMGHTHVPEIKKLESGLYINTGDWIEHFSYVTLEAGEFKLEHYDHKEK